ncbi:MAG TPA: hypothetical protein VFB14_10945 [Bryobacteraceae bacterium]|nr:hypothetical protein [Bryobacteraceae bacterium]
MLDLTTNLLNGTFSLVVADGDALFGNVSEDQTAPDTAQTEQAPSLRL